MHINASVRNEKNKSAWLITNNLKPGYYWLLYCSTQFQIFACRNQYALLIASDSRTMSSLMILMRRTRLVTQTQLAFKRDNSDGDK